MKYQEMTVKEREEELRQEAGKAVRHGQISIVLIQAVICAVILLTLTLLRLFVPQVYKNAMEWYDAEISKSVMIPYDELSHI